MAFRRDCGLHTGFIDDVQVTTTNNYNTVADFHTLQISPQCSY
jgi:hypothetical protein